MHVSDPRGRMAPSSRLSTRMTPDSAELRPGQPPQEIPSINEVGSEIGIILLVCLGVVLIGTLFAHI